MLRSFLFLSINFISFINSIPLSFPKYIDHECIRDCSSLEQMSCVYNFTLETYSTMSRACFDCPKNFSDCFREDCIPGDGIVKTIEIVNRQLPGPYIQVCKGDTIIVNVNNRLRSQRVATIHWHGLTQKASNHMDGVSMITQWPILPHTSFQYKFEALEPGTHFWHAGLSRSDGLFGPLIIRDTKYQKLDLYDFDMKEHYIILNEWHKYPLMSIYGSYVHSGYFGTEYSILINGKGAFPDQPDTLVPLETFHVKHGFRYRFRLISSAAENCIMKVSIDEHRMTIIEADGHPIEPVKVDFLVLLVGERYDFVLEANKRPADYWIKVKGEGNCGFNKIYQKAILRYNDSFSQEKLNSSVSLKYEDSDRNGSGFSSVLKNLPNMKNYLDLKSNTSDENGFDKIISREPDTVLYLNFDLKPLDDPEFHNAQKYSFNNSLNTWHSSVINNIKFETPSKPILQHWNKMVKQLNICNETKTPCGRDKNFCECTHYIELKLNQLVELVMIDGNGFFEKHSIYIHGHDFAIVGMKKLKEKRGQNLTNDEVKRLDLLGKLERNFVRPVIKDTVSIPTGGYTIVRFVADNPGFWMLHCHLDTHSDPGMAILIRTI